MVDAADGSAPFRWHSSVRRWPLYDERSVGRIARIYLPLLAVLLSAEAFAQQETSKEGWRFSALAEVFILPDEQDYFNPTFYARYNNLHLEARYNYEDVNTASLWAGRR